MVRRLSITFVSIRTRQRPTCINPDKGPAGSYIQDLQFKSDQAYDSELMKLYEEDYPLENTLGLAFNLPNDTGEIHELLLEKSGDVKTVYKLDGFGTIQKITFAQTTQAY